MLINAHQFKSLIVIHWCLANTVFDSSYLIFIANSSSLQLILLKDVIIILSPTQSALVQAQIVSLINIFKNGFLSHNLQTLGRVVVGLSFL